MAEGEVDRWEAGMGVNDRQGVGQRRPKAQPLLGTVIEGGGVAQQRQGQRGGHASHVRPHHRHGWGRAGLSRE